MQISCSKSDIGGTACRNSNIVHFIRYGITVYSYRSIIYLYRYEPKFYVITINNNTYSVKTNILRVIPIFLILLLVKVENVIRSELLVITRILLNGGVSILLARYSRVANGFCCERVIYYITYLLF